MAQSVLMGWDIQTVSVVTSGVVAVSGVIVPALLRRGDRKHEREMLSYQRVESWKAEWWTQRQKVYEDAMRLVLHLSNYAQALADPEHIKAVPEPQNPTHDVAPRMDTWGSKAMREAFEAFQDADNLLRLDEDDIEKLAASARESLTAMGKAYAAMREIVNRELRAGPENAPD